MRITIIVFCYFLLIFSLICLGEINFEKRVKRHPYDLDNWFDQKLDHHNPNDDRKWKQRFHVNYRYYEQGGPVFLHIEGESKLKYETIFTEQFTWIELAKEFNALCFQLEHRFYAEIYPTNVSNIESLKYLTIHQALADVIEFVRYIPSMVEGPYNLIAFGASYAGTLAIWARMHYPYLIHGAIVSSPLTRFEIENHESINIVKEVLNTFNSSCVKQIKNSVEKLKDYFETDNGSDLITDKFNLCNSPKTVNEVQKFQLIMSLRTVYTDAVKYNGSSTFDIKYLCGIMANKSSLTGFKEATLKYLDNKQMSCLDDLAEKSTEDLNKMEKDFSIAENVLSKYNSECAKAIQLSENRIYLALKSRLGTNTIVKLFKLCNNPKIRIEKSRQNFFQRLMSIFYKAVQIDGIVKNIINSVCNIMENEQLGQSIDRLAILMRIQNQNRPCIPFDYYTFFRKLKTSPDPQSVNERTWFYQLCSEIGQFDVSKYGADLFGQNVPIKYYEDICIRLFGESFNFKELQKRQKILKNLFIKIEDHQILVVHGSNDPNYDKNITKTFDGYFTTIVVKGGAHCQDSYSKNKDSNLKILHEEKKNYLLLWLGIKFEHERENLPEIKQENESVKEIMP